MPQTDTVKKFRTNIATQMEWSLRTNRSINELVVDIQKQRGNKKLQNLWRSHNVHSLSTPRVLREVSEALSSLETETGLTCPDIVDTMRYRHNNTPLAVIFNQIADESEQKVYAWGPLKKQEVKSAIQWFLGKCKTISIPRDVNTLSATSIHDFFISSRVAPLQTLGALEDFDLTDWQSDVSVLKHVLQKLPIVNTGFQAWPWIPSSCPYNPVTKRYYDNFYNFIILNAIASANRYTSNLWATRKQWANRGYHVNAEEYASPVFHFFALTDQKDLRVDHDGGRNSNILLEKVSPVFSAEQVRDTQGSPFQLPQLVKTKPDVDVYIRKHKVKIEHHNSRKAYYDHRTDTIRMPDMIWFRNQREPDQATLDYYGTLLHEMIHWTGHESRLARGPTSDRMSEELVAELGSGFLCARLGLADAERLASSEQTILVEYLNSWLFRGSYDLLLDAARRANQASNYILYKGFSE